MNNIVNFHNKKSSLKDKIKVLLLNNNLHQYVEFINNDEQFKELRKSRKIVSEVELKNAIEKGDIESIESTFKILVHLV